MRRTLSRRSKVRWVDEAAANKLFSKEQRALWPTGYLPSMGAAHFLREGGVEARDVWDAREDMAEDNRNLLQHDLAHDYSRWTRAVLMDFLVKRLEETSERKRLFRKFSNRERLCSHSDVSTLWSLPNDWAELTRAAAAAADGIPRPSPSSTSTPKAPPPPPKLIFTPYAAVQEYALIPMRQVDKPTTKVQFHTYPQLRDCLMIDHDPLSPMKCFSMMCGDSFVFTQEWIVELAVYLRNRLEELGSDAVAKVLRSGEKVYRPVLLTFSNGRLAHHLNESGLLPCKVVAMHLEAQARRHRPTKFPFPEGTVSSSWKTIYPTEAISVVDALVKYEPAVVLVEPHIGRDWGCDLRGYATVREVLFLGQVDSPAMGSFAFPLLTFGVLPGPQTYWVYNKTMQRTAQMEMLRLPMDPPHVAQGYQRKLLDSISQFMVHPNDSQIIAHQSQCLSFRRVETPEIKGK